MRMAQVIRIRFDYAEARVPWIRQSPSTMHPGDHGHALLAVAGPDADRDPRSEAWPPTTSPTKAEFDIAEGETVDTVS